ncbi:MAG: hypothetical protein JNL01_03890 [Bdellovibrionales bacterium]|nr:hypothetical protein [Bdellovibrionales bacterium]
MSNGFGVAFWLRMQLDFASYVSASFSVLIPIGLGFWLSGAGFLKPFPESVKSSNTQETFQHFILGVGFSTFLFLLLELNQVRLDSIRFFQKAVFLVGLLGAFFAGIRILRSRKQDPWGIDLLIPVSVFLWVLIDKDAIHQSFPVLNVFQWGHLMEGATQFAERQVLNRFIGDSYVPLFQVGYGLVKSQLGSDLLSMWWISGFLLAIAFAVLVFRISQSVYGPAGRGRNYFALSQVIFFPMVLGFSNGGFSSLIALYSLYVLFSRQDQWMNSKNAKRTVGTFLSLILLTVFLRALLGRPFSMNSALVGLAATSGMAMTPWLRKRWNLPWVLDLVFLSVLGVLFHRSHLLEGALIYLIPVAFHCVQKFSKPVLGLAGIAWIAVSTWAGYSNWFVRGPWREWIGTMTGKRIDPSNLLDISGGFRNAIFEWIRIWPIFASLVFLVIYLFRFFGTSKNEKPRVEDAFCFVGLFAVGVSLFGVPYAYRVSFLVQFFFFFFLFRSFESLDFSGLRRPLKYLAGASILISVSIYAWAGLNDYLRVFALPAIVAAVGIGATLLGWSLDREKNRSYLFLISALLSLLYFEQRWIVIRFYDYSYGNWVRPEGKPLISHYSKREYQDLMTLDLPERGPDVFLSDPVTLVHLKAFQGLPSLYLFPNLSDLSSQFEAKVVSLLETLRVQGSPEQERRLIEKFIQDAPFSTVTHVLERYASMDPVRVHVLFNARTLQWLKCKGDGGACFDYFVDPSRPRPPESLKWAGGARCVGSSCFHIFRTIYVPRSAFRLP